MRESEKLEWPVVRERVGRIAKEKVKVDEGDMEEALERVTEKPKPERCGRSLFESRE